jgi:hypothetical protein
VADVILDRILLSRFCLSGELVHAQVLFFYLADFLSMLTPTFG